MKECLKTARAFIRAAEKAGLVFGDNHQQVPGTTHFQFYSNRLGYIITGSDPFDLARLVLMGQKYADSMGYGEHTSMLNSYTNLSEVMSIASESEIGRVLWDYPSKFEPQTTFEAWLLTMTEQPKSLREKIVRRKLTAFLDKRHGLPISTFDSLLLWLS